MVQCKGPAVLCLIILGLSISCTRSDQGNVLDIRDNQRYEWIRIGELKWFRTNLAYLPEVHTVTQQSDSIPMYYVYGNESTSVEQAKKNYIPGSLGDSLFNPYARYGVLYNHAAILDASGVCPEGWRVPTDEEWSQLEVTLGMDPGAVRYLGHRPEGNLGHLLKDTIGWGNNGNGIDAFNLAIKPAGECFSGSRYHSEAVSAVYWSSTTDEFGNALVRKFSCCDRGVLRDWADRRDGYSVRCVQ